MKQLTGLILLLIMTGCSSLMSGSGSEASDMEALDDLTHRLKSQQRQIETLEEQKLLLEKKLQSAEESGGSGKESEQRSTRAKAQGELAELSSQKDFYSYILQQYREKDVVSLNMAKKLFLKRFPLSVHADNVIFWQGRLLLKQGRLGESIKSFNEILRSYPKGNKRVSAIFYKGVAYKRLNLKAHAIAMFQDVKKHYPGSQESQRAQMELRLLSKKADKKETQIN